jgi:hypothetical protein
MNVQQSVSKWKAIELSETAVALHNSNLEDR